jgi:ABC-2 type transport system permease protein
MAAFFTLLFGPALLILLGLIFRNVPDPMYGGLGYLDMAVPAYIAMILGIVGLTALPITGATRREMGVLWGSFWADSPFLPWATLWSG